MSNNQSLRNKTIKGVCGMRTWGGAVRIERIVIKVGLKIFPVVQ